ncbi:MAG: flavodoxin-dependent (E)-4-hydroxy-3-methylbut-2-enyl-diphosphate synthase, partial [Candidatus Theseobacter exili]|nr:flavodoxin-dependent (E)-4-hydroxy-3-methylbut-2-enyl-diphosphate synthase [Candidatus Theseobacter exili]
IGVNSGSIEPQILRKYGAPNGRALAASVLKQVKIVEKMGITDIVLSAKAFDVMVTIEANRILSCETEYPLHLGITEAGTLIQGVLRSAVGIGQLLSEGIGDTIRVSLSDKPEREIYAGFGILKSLNMRKRGITVIACPTCGRTEIDVKGIAEKVEKELVFIKTPVTIAVMGCVVNGPGEARMADIGIAGGKKKGVIFQRGDIVKTVNENLLAEELINRVKEIDKLGIMED